MEPTATQKRLGDGFYEQRLVREQMGELTGRAPANGESDDSLYQQLLTSAVSFAQQFDLRPGIALSAEQMSRLTSDIVWTESQLVRLPDGSPQTVLVPKVYLAHVADKAMLPGGALVTGASVEIRTEEGIVNRGGVIDAGKGAAMLVSRRDIVNQGGSIAGGAVLLAAARDVRNESLAVTQNYASSQTSGNYTSLSNQAAITASGVLQVSAGRDVSDVAGKIGAGSASISAARDVNFDTLQTGSTYQSKVAGHVETDSVVAHLLSQLNTASNLVVGAGRDISLSGAQVAIGGSGALVAGRAVNVSSVTNEINTDQQNDAASKLYDKQVHQNQTVVGTAIGATGTLQVTAGATEQAALNISGSKLAAGGAIALDASGDVNIRGVQEQHVYDTAIHRESHSVFNSISTSSADYRAVSKVAGSSVSGDVVTVTSGNDIRIVGAAIAGQSGVNLVATNAVTIEAGTETSTESHHHSVKESGFLSGGGLGITYGTRTTTTDQQQDATIQSGQARSLVGAIDGSLNVGAGGAIKVAGSDLSAGKDINLVGKSVSITPGQDAFNGQFASKMTQDGITLALGGSVVNALATTAAMGGAAAQTGDGRIKALAAATAVMAGAGAAKDLAANGPSIGISLTVGHTESEQHESTGSTVHSGSVLAAGDNVVISATGAGKDSNIDIVGSDVSAKQNITLLADNQVNLLAAQDADSHHSESTSKSASVGIAAKVRSGATAYGITAGVSAGRGSADGEATTQINNHVTAGEKLTIGSGGDTNVKGAVASGAQVVADVKGNLNIESLQDKATFDSKNQSISVNATVGAGASISGGVNQSKVHNDYASVQEQSALRAGDGGFQVKVGGNTDLKGAVISSSAAGADASSLTTGTLTHSDIANHATMDASSIGLSGGMTVAGNGADKGSDGVKLLDVGKPGAGVSLPGIAATSSSETGVSRSGIGAGALVITDDAAQRSATGEGATQAAAGLNRNVVTGSDTSGRVGNHFDPNAVQASLAVTAAFTAAAAPLAANLVGDIGTAKEAKAQYDVQAYGMLAAAANERGDTAASNAYAAQAREAQSVADSWGDNGANRIALHAAAQGLIGALAGGKAGVLSDVSGVIGGNLGHQLGKSLGEAEADKQKLTGLARENLVNTYQQTLAGVGGALAGLATSGATGQNGINMLASTTQGASTATAVDVFNRQLHPNEIARIKALAGKDAAKEGRLTAAACAAVKCYAEYPVDSEAYQKLKQLADIGNSPALSNERQQLANQAGLFGYTTSGMVGDASIDAAKQLNNTYQIGTRALGAGQMVLGGLGVVGSIATAPVSCATGIGCVANAAVGTISLDAGYAGAKQLVSGNPESTYVNQGFQALGMSPQAAGLVEAALGIGSAATAVAAANKAIDQAIAISKLSTASYREFTTNGVKITPEVMQTPQAQAL